MLQFVLAFAKRKLPDINFFISFTIKKEYLKNLIGPSLFRSLEN